MGRIIQRARSADIRGAFPRDLSRSVFWQDDFTDGSSPPGWTVRVNGAGSQVVTANTAANEDHVGILSLLTGTTTTGRAAIAHLDSSELQSIGPGNGPTIAEWDVHSHGSLSDETDAYAYTIGLHDAANASGEGSDGLYFKYIHSENSGNWTLHARNGGAETVVNTSTAYVVQTYYRLTIVRNALNTQADFLINDVLVGSITSNLPAGAANRTQLAAKVEKSAGTNSRGLYVDYVMFYRGVRR